LKRIALIGLLALSAAAPRPTHKAAPDAALFAEAKRVTADNMRDPDSARFRNLRKVRSDFEQGWKVCGEVNAKNAYGGYVGYTSFVYIPIIHQALIRTDPTERAQLETNDIVAENKLFVGCD
jgi:hypothetical protein